MALDAVHAWGVRWRFSFGIGTTKCATMVFGPLRGCLDCCVHLGGVPTALVHLGVVRSPTLSWRPHVDFICSRGDRLFHQASAWCLGEGLPLSVSSSIFVTYVLCSSSFGLEIIGDDLFALQQLNLALRRWYRHLLGWPRAPLLQQCTGNLVLAMHNAFPSDVHSPCSVACALLTTPLLVRRSLPVCSGSLPSRKGPGRTGACLLFTLCPAWVFLLAPRPRHSIGGSPKRSVLVWTVTYATNSPPWCPICMVSLLTSFLKTSSQSGKTRCTLLTFLLLPLVFGVLLAGAMTTPPQAVPLITGKALPPAPFATTWTAPSCIIFLLALLSATLGLLGLIPVAYPCLKLRRWHNTVGYLILSMKQTCRNLSGPTSSSLDAFATNSNHRFGDPPHNSLNL